MTSLDRPRRNPDFVYRTVADECVLVPIVRQAGELDSIYALNEVGGFIWQHLDGTHDVAALTAAIAAQFEVTAAEAEADLREFLAQLETIGALGS